MGMISNYQLRKIYAIAQNLGMVTRGGDDVLHDLVRSVAGKEHIKDLTYDEAFRLIGELEVRQGENPLPRKKARPHKGRSGGASDGQQRKVWALMYRLQKASPSTAPLGDRLCGIIRKELHIDALPADPFAWLDYRACSRLVETIKGYVATAEGKKEGCSG